MMNRLLQMPWRHLETVDDSTLVCKRLTALCTNLTN